MIFVGNIGVGQQYNTNKYRLLIITSEMLLFQTVPLMGNWQVMG